MTTEPASDLPPVTVVIPAYNLALYLADAVESVLRQSYRGPVSVVILDDGSSDATLEIAHRLAKQHGGIHVHTQPNQGRARNSQSAA